MVSGVLRQCGGEGGVVEVSSAPALRSLRHGRKGGGDQSCPRGPLAPLGTTWRKIVRHAGGVAEWRSGGVAE